MIQSSTYLKPSKRPIFMRNICAFWGMTKNQSDRLAIFVAFGARLGNRWLDETKIKASAASLRDALVLYRMLRCYSAWELINQPYGGLAETICFYKRLKGLIDSEDRLSFGAYDDRQLSAVQKWKRGKKCLKQQ